MEQANKNPLTMQMLTKTLTEHYSYGSGTVLLLILGTILIVGGIASLAAGVGFAFLAGGILIWRWFLKDFRKRNDRKTKIRTGQFYLLARPLWQKEIVPGDSYSDESYVLCLDGNARVTVSKWEYQAVGPGDTVWQLWLEGEDEAVATYIEKLTEPDPQVQTLIR